MPSIAIELYTSPPVEAVLWVRVTPRVLPVGAFTLGALQGWIVTGPPHGAVPWQLLACFDEVTVRRGLGVGLGVEEAASIAKG